MDTKFERLLNLVAVLDSATGPLTAREIRGRIGSYSQNDAAFRRTFERDKADLLEMGIPLQVVSGDGPDGPVSAYVLDRRLEDPGLSAAELAALHAAVRKVGLWADDDSEAADVVEAFRKLGGLVERPAVASAGEIHVDHIVAQLFAAITSGRSATFRHLGADRRLVPRKLVLRRGRWYVSGFDLDRMQSRTFRLDRIDGGVVLGDAVPIPAGEVVADLRMRPWEYGSTEPVTATVALDPEVVPVALAADPELPVAEERPDGSLVVQLEVSNPAGLWSWLSEFLDRAELLGPPELRSAWIDLLTVLADGGEVRS